jgi:hypothetical protein
MINRVFSLNKVKNKEKYLFDTTKDNLDHFIIDTQCFLQNTNKEYNKIVGEINLLKLKILSNVIGLILKEKLDNLTINSYTSLLTKDLNSFRLKESTINENMKISENFFKDIVFKVPNLCRIRDIILPLLKDFEMDETVINELNDKCSPNTIQIKDEESSNVSNSSNLLKKKRHARVSTPEQNPNIKEKIYSYFKIIGKSNDGAKIVSNQPSERKTPQSERKVSVFSDNKCENINTVSNSSFAILGEQTFNNYNNLVEFSNPKKPLTSRKFIDNCYFPEAPENSNFSFADRDSLTRKILVVNNGYNNYSSSSKKSTNYSIISYPTVKEFSIIQEPPIEQIIIDNNNSMRSNKHNFHRGINRRLPELQYLPRTKKKQLSGKKKKTKGQSSLLYQYFEELNKSNSEKYGSDDENSEPNVKGINGSYFARNNTFDKESTFHVDENRSGRKKNVPIKNLNNKEYKNTSKEECMKNYKFNTNYPQNKLPIKSSIFNREVSPVSEKSEEEIIAYSTPDNVNKKFFNPKPKICVNLFNSHH